MVVASPNSMLGEKILPIDLPMIDLSSEKSMVMKLIVKACEEYGFFNVINHGVPHDIISKMEKEGFDFFAKPMEEKKLVALDNPFGYGCKNIGFNGDMGEVEYLLLNANVPSIPNDPSNFSSTVSAYTKGVKELACKILELIAEGLGVHDTSIFSRFIRHVHNDSLLRLNHYPPIPPILSNRVGFGEHSDPQIITILRSNDVAGLQISLQDGMWNPVTPHPSAFCVNVGDLLQVMTNERFVSVRHRAVTNSNKCRMSVAYFGGPPLNACIVAPSVMVTPNRPSLLFKPFTWDEYKKLTYSLRLGDNRIDFFRQLQ
ncbi:gibberellin 2-beta-dioxygenase 2-like [Cicer arietinum]|uniref:gibberellin 2beta-dioxygenase n=1 Tax=Cicer arietinum TaxID=3827 RepID=A0A1S2XB08_CICAR|nr:gibberellin 2-beta-dioxygenase 2-like [Cicer arietinum]